MVTHPGTNHALLVICYSRVMHSIALSIYGDDEHGRMIRRTLMRYINLTLTLVLRSISSAVKRRFPTMDHLVEAGEYWSCRRSWVRFPQDDSLKLKGTVLLVGSV